MVHLKSHYTSEVQSSVFIRNADGTQKNVCHYHFYNKIALCKRKCDFLKHHVPLLGHLMSLGHDHKRIQRRGPAKALGPRNKHTKYV